MYVRLNLQQCKGPNVDKYFFHPTHFSCVLFFFFWKCPSDFWILKSELSFSFVMGWKKWFFHQFGFYNSKTSKNKAHSLLFSDYRIRTPPKHFFQGKNRSNYIIRIVSAQILSMFITWIIILRIILIFITLNLMF